jgi:hypothetical protein
MKTILPVFLFFASIFILFSIGHYGGDGYEDYLTAESIVLNHKLSFYDRPDDMDELNYKKGVGITGKDGNTYSSRGGLVVPFVLSLFYYIGHLTANFFNRIPHDFVTMFFVSFANPVVSAMNCLFIFLLARMLYFSTRISFALAAIYGLATMAPVYTRTGFSEPILVLCMLLSLYFSLKYKNSVQKRYLILAAITLSFMVSARSSAVIFIPAFIFYIIWIIMEKKKDMASRLRDGATFAMSLTALLTFICTVNYVIYGGIFSFGGKDAVGIANRIAGSVDIMRFIKGLYYYMLSAGKSFFLFNLPLLLAIPGLAKVAANRRKEAMLFVLIFLSNLIFFVMTFRRGSLFSWGPRYMLPSTAFLIFLVGNFCENNKNLAGRSSAWLFSIAGFLVMIPCMFINQSKFYFFVKEKLNLPEYMINFMPDLSPIRGAWDMFISRLILIGGGPDVPFIYNPDFKFFQPVAASMSAYSNFDFWFLKIFALKPEFSLYIYAIMVFLGAIALTSIVSIIRSLRGKAG